MGTKRKQAVMESTDQIKIVTAEEANAAATGENEGSDKDQVATSEATATDATSTDAATTAEGEEAAKPAKKKVSRGRSGRYLAVRAQIDKTKKYDAFAAVELVKKLSYSRFDGTITAHAVVKEVGFSASLTLPHSTGKSVRVEIVSDDVLKKIEAGVIEFDILVAHPSFMPRLAKFASVLGPKGLMPNPKSGTLTPNPEAQKKKLEGGTITIKSEKKAPLLHIRMGKVSMPTKELVENVETLLKTLGTKVERLSIAATMSPGVKIDTTIAE